MKQKKDVLGKRGEELATNYLEQNGYTIRRRNYRYGKAELDIIASIGAFIVIIEVRSRSSTRLQGIAETISRKKIKKIVEATDRYLQVRELNEEVRFDVITVHFGENPPLLEHIPNAFYHF